VITESHRVEQADLPLGLVWRAATELFAHGWEKEARVYAERALAELRQRPDSIDRETMNIRQDAYAVLRRYDDAVHWFQEMARRYPVNAHAHRVMAMPFQVASGDTAGALALVDSIRTQPLSTYPRFHANSNRGRLLYYGAQILSLLGRKEQAVALLREALNNGARIAAPPDEYHDLRLQWFWEPIRDYPPFQELVRLR